MSIGCSMNVGNVYIKGIDYIIDMLIGKIICMGINLKFGVQVYVNYIYVDFIKVIVVDIVGVVNMVGDCIGMKLLQDIWNQFGFYVKILIVLVFCM